MLVLIDGDIFRYRCGFAAERNYYLVELTNANDHKEWKEFDYKKEASEYIVRVTSGVKASARIWARKEVQPLENALQIVKLSLTQAIEDVKAGVADEQVEVRIYLSGKENFRESLAVTKPYKGNRELVSKPMYYKEIGDYLVDTWKATYTQGIEADDAIGIDASAHKGKNGRAVVVSNDKDLRQIPTLHYNWVTKEFFEVSAKEAKTQFFIQLIAGDATDNVPGIPGCGPAIATKVLEECKSPEDMVDITAKLYKSNIGTGWQEYFLEQASLVYILKSTSTTHPKETLMWIDTKEGKYFKEKYTVNEEKQEQIPAATKRA